jgi:hypothetical protein
LSGARTPYTYTGPFVNILSVTITSTVFGYGFCGTFIEGLRFHGFKKSNTMMDSLPVIVCPPVGSCVPP